MWTISQAVKNFSSSAVHKGASVQAHEGLESGHPFVHSD
jgi:hypothetical protein